MSAADPPAHAPAVPAAPAGGGPRARLGAVFLVGAAALLTHFARLPQLGLYEDDYWAIAPNLGAPLGRLAPTLAFHFTSWPQGRPLNHFLPVLLSTVGSWLGGLEGVYVLAAAWLAVNGILVLAIVRRVASDEAAVVAALTYLLFPADSTKVLLVHAAHVQGAMTFLLVGAWLWLGGGRSRALSYPVAALSLLAYETAFLPFLAVPLLRRTDRRSALRALGVHLALCAGIVGTVAAIRFATGDARAAEAAGSPARTLFRMAASTLLGPLASGRSVLASPLVGLRRLDALAALVSALLVVGLGSALRAGRSAPAPAAREEASPAPSAPGRPAAALLLATGLATWAASYALTIVNYPPTQTIGRLTSTHVAAAWPVSLVAAALWEIASRRGRRWRFVAAAAFSVWIVGAVGYHHHLGREYVRAWRQEQRFWSDVMDLAPDAGPGWTVIAEGTRPLSVTGVIFSNSWADYWTFADIFSRGFDDGRPAFGHLGYLGPDLQFRRDGDAIAWRPEFWGGPFVRIDPARLVLLHDDHGALRRVSEIDTPAGRLTSTAPAPRAGRAVWPDTPVSRLLFPDRFR